MIQRIVKRLRNSRICSPAIVVALLMALWTTGTVGANAPGAPLEPESAPTILNYQGIANWFAGGDSYLAVWLRETPVLIGFVSHRNRVSWIHLVIRR